MSFRWGLWRNGTWMLAVSMLSVACNSSGEGGDRTESAAPDHAGATVEGLAASSDFVVFGSFGETLADNSNAATEPVRFVRFEVAETLSGDVSGTIAIAVPPDQSLPTGEALVFLRTLPDESTLNEFESSLGEVFIPTPGENSFLTVDGDELVSSGLGFIGLDADSPAAQVVIDEQTGQTIVQSVDFVTRLPIDEVVEILSSENRAAST